VLAVQAAQRFHGLLVVVQRLTHAHEHDVEWLVEETGGRGEHADLTGNFASRELADQTHLSRQAESASHRASNLRRDAERHRRGVRDEDRFDSSAVGELQSQLARPVCGGFVAGDARGVDDELVLQPETKCARQVCHPAEIRDAVPVDPAKDLPGVERLATARRKQCLELGRLELSDVALRRTHAISRVFFEMRALDCSKNGHWLVARSSRVLFNDVSCYDPRVLLIPCLSIVCG
jgi:hypothetical protein